jgi:hypothetical protein
MASIGIATTLLEGSTTTYSRFGIPLKTYINSTYNILKRSHLTKLLHHTKLIIWDEAIIMRKEIFKAINHTLRDILDCSTTSFRGIIMCFSSNFRQTLLVILGTNRAEVVGTCLKKSML